MVKEEGRGNAILQNHQENVDGKCPPDKHSYSNSKLTALFVLRNSVAIAPTMVSSHHYSLSYFSKLHLDIIL